ncbi:1-acyl-sn-glycerol-3-phosphate acyltransferase [Corynebacterium sp. CNCTC7651]|uniref:lysophospholipid acyltransferase family protein n=1 Tax=Corynebacterium sp. CNCTC7651 TaxID=2815361 RepID=UPI001F399A4B|nr:lysophospholipid acyltransferase family protein [Corynebacterium sp. CNCTC7651]UIZ91591.1 1-acyl-sn-glycerol-3-phosphate acyltransferase [Corynebacterium sp. CNCTC7651]
MQNHWYSLFKAILGPPLLVWNRPTISGSEHIPETGPVILASNHQAVMDSFYLPLMMRRQIQFPAKKEYFTAPGLKGRIQKFFFSSVGQIPVDRSSSDAGAALQQAAEDVLGRGDVFGIYPEGTRSPDGRVYRGRTGMARIAMATGVPVVLIAMIGTRDANPIGTSIPRPAKVRIKVSEPIDPHAWAQEHGFDPSSRDVMRPFTDYVMHELAKLVGSPNVDVYASDVKKALEQTGEYPEGAEPGGEKETVVADGKERA